MPKQGVIGMLAFNLHLDNGGLIFGWEHSPTGFLFFKLPFIKIASFFMEC